ncbi:MAG: 2' O-ribose methyltransferase [Lichina confinis]|nr:MAG: 2' O-ribose methyltransferase [Lichina confinis]
MAKPPRQRRLQPGGEGARTEESRCINEKYKVLKRGQTVVDLGFAPGSWTEVAVNRTAPNGRVLGIDIIPAKPPKGASAIQGNFLSPAVQEEVKQFLRDPKRGRPRSQKFFVGDEAESDEVNGLTEAELEEVERGYIDIERHASVDDPHADPALEGREDGGWRRLQKGPVPEDGRMVDVVLSDMSDPWPQTSGYHIRSLSAPYSRMMNTSGISFRDHAGSMETVLRLDFFPQDLCLAALRFCFDTLRPGGHFVCKFYQGAEDKALETKLRRLFTTVHREKPEASRSLSKEGFFVALRREKNITLDELFRERSG